MPRRVCPQSLPPAISGSVPIIPRVCPQGFRVCPHNLDFGEGEELALERMIGRHRSMPVKMILLKIQHRRRLKGIGRQFCHLHLETAHLHHGPFQLVVSRWSLIIGGGALAENSPPFPVLQHNLTEGLPVVPAGDAAKRIGDKLHDGAFPFASRHCQHPTAPCTVAFGTELKLRNDRYARRPCGDLPRMGERYSRARYAQIPSTAGPGIIAIQDTDLPALAPQQCRRRLTASPVAENDRIHSVQSDVDGLAGRA